MSFFQAWMTGLRLRTCMTTVVYDKILRLRLTSLGQVGACALSCVLSHVCYLMCGGER